MAKPYLILLTTLSMTLLWRASGIQIREAFPVVNLKEIAEGEISEEPEFARFYLRKLFLDLVGPTVADLDGSTGVAITTGKDQKGPQTSLIKNKRPETMANISDSNYPGSTSEGRVPSI